MTDRDKFEAWAKTEYEVNDFGQILIGGDDSVEYDVSAQDCSEEMFDAWQAATEQSQKEIAEKDALIAELEDYKNSVIDQFVTAHHSYDESISAYENISKLIAYHQDIALDPKVSSVAARWVTQIEALQAREKVLVEAISISLNCIREEINLNNYTETLLGDFISDYGDMVTILQHALANVRGD